MYFYLEQVKESHYLPRIFTWWYLPIQYRPCNLCCDLSVRHCQLQVKMFQFSSVQSLSHAWLPPHGLQHTRPPCPSPTPRAFSNSCPSSQWCHPTILSSVVPFSFCLQSFLASGSFPMSQFFTSGGQSIGSFSFSISPPCEYSGLTSFRMDWFDLLAVQGTLHK